MDAARWARPRPTMFVAILSLGALLAACGSVSTPDATATDALVRASAGLCQALGDLPDAQAASRTFTNVAHDPLHRLAADQRLDRSLQASVLRAMQRVEEDFSQSVGAEGLYGDIRSLKAWTDQALEALAVGVPACDS